ncbi:MAG TPA: Em GEA1 (EM1) [Candidatus Nanoarchaeia archaeon]|nr:Em GEA1 (EM1) [Candidatus Nanoarchaeia archaeon]
MEGRSEEKERSARDRGGMTVRQAGHKGGQRVRELIKEGKETEER